MPVAFIYPHKLLYFIDLGSVLIQVVELHLEFLNFRVKFFYFVFRCREVGRIVRIELVQRRVLINRDLTLIRESIRIILYHLPMLNF
jgi:hypothetical protein